MAAPASQHVNQGGNDSSGFRITYLPGAHELRIECWGYWPRDVAADFARETVLTFQKIGARVDLSFDASRLKPQGVDGQGALRLVMNAMGSLAFSRATVLSSDVLCRMQLTRIARECGVDSLLSFRDRGTIDSGP